MTFDIDAALDAAQPFEFAVKIGDDRRLMRQPTVAELAQLQTVEGKTLDAVRTLVATLFVVPVDVSSFDERRLSYLMAAYLAYFSELEVKNVGRVAAAVRDHLNRNPVAD